MDSTVSAGGIHPNCTWSVKGTDSDSLIRAISLLQERQKRARLREVVVLASNLKCSSRARKDNENKCNLHFCNLSYCSHVYRYKSIISMADLISLICPAAYFRVDSGQSGLRLKGEKSCVQVLYRAEYKRFELEPRSTSLRQSRF